MYLCNFIVEEVTIKNWCFYLHLSKVFYLKDLEEFLLSLCLNCFLTNYQPDVLLELSFTDISTLVSSSNLKIDSELEIFNAIVSWVGYKKFERKCYTDKLLSLVRLPLLTEEILKNVVKEHPLCSNSTLCKNIINKALKAKRNKFQNVKKFWFENRCNSQINFDKNEILFFGSELSFKNDTFEPLVLSHITDRNTIDEIKSTNNMLKQMPEKFVCTLIGTKIYCFIGDQGEKDGSFQVYCRRTDQWNRLEILPKKRYINVFCTCAFVGKIYVFGGLHHWDNNFVYDPDKNNWKKILSKINSVKYKSSCTVFNGQCVIIGGITFTENRQNYLKLVESYDDYLDKWSLLPNLNIGRKYPGLLARGNKLFVISGGCDKHEVYDCMTKKFTLIAPFRIKDTLHRPYLHTDGNRIYVFGSWRLDGDLAVPVYDVTENKWQSTVKTPSKYLREGHVAVSFEKYLK